MTGKKKSPIRFKILKNCQKKKKPCQAQIPLQVETTPPAKKNTVIMTSRPLNNTLLTNLCWCGTISMFDDYEQAHKLAGCCSLCFVCWLPAGFQNT